MKVQKDLSGICLENGYKILNAKGVAIIGMSPNNSYFKPHIIRDLIEFALQEFSQIYIFVPDVPATHTFKALGYTLPESQKKARLYGNNFKNHAARALETLDLEGYKTTHASIIDWNSDIEQNEQYQKQLQYVRKLYETNQEFRDDTRSETARVIEGYKHRPQVATQEALDEGAQYILKELAFFLAAESILKTKQITLLYHNRWPVFEKFFSGHYDYLQREIGLLIVRAW